MKRGRQKNPRRYIEIRIEQLLEDRKKVNLKQSSQIRTNTND